MLEKGRTFYLATVQLPTELLQPFLKRAMYVACTVHGALYKSNL